MRTLSMCNITHYPYLYILTFIYKFNGLYTVFHLIIMTAIEFFIVFILFYNKFEITCEELYGFLEDIETDKLKTLRMVRRAGDLRAHQDANWAAPQREQRASLQLRHPQSAAARAAAAAAGLYGRAYHLRRSRGRLGKLGNCGSQCNFTKISGLQNISKNVYKNISIIKNISNNKFESLLLDIFIDTFVDIFCGPDNFVPLYWLFIIIYINILDLIIV